MVAYASKYHIGRKVPYDLQGNMMSFVRVEKDVSSVEWKANTPFWTTLKFLTFVRGRSSVGAIFTDKKSGHRFTMFLSDFISTVIFLVDGEVTGKFHIVKRGAYYGVALIPTSPIEQLALQAEE